MRRLVLNFLTYICQSHLAMKIAMCRKSQIFKEQFRINKELKRKNLSMGKTILLFPLYFNGNIFLKYVSSFLNKSVDVTSYTNIQQSASRKKLKAKL